MKFAVASALVACTALVIPAMAAGPLFPTPLHITRQIEDPISGSKITLNEYGYGNRLVSVRGNVTAIADYEKGELIEIDRDAGTYSVTRFEAIAKASQIAGVTAVKPKRPIRSIAAKPVPSGRTAEFFDAQIDTQTIEVGVDRSVTLSKEALEVLIGAAYPGVRSGQHEIVLSAAAPGRLSPGSQAVAFSDALYALPVEQVIRHEVEGETLEFRSSVTRVAADPPPADLVSIPAGARLVDSRIVAVARELERQEQPGPPPTKRP
jgi:hypothetical protein